MCVDCRCVCLDVSGFTRPQDGRVGLGGVFHFLARRCGQLGCDALVDEPHGAHELLHELVVDVGQQAGVERDVRLQVGRARVRVFGHRLDELPQVRVRGSLHGAGEWNRDPEVEGAACVDDRVQGLRTVDLVEGGAQNERLDERLHGHVADVGSRTLTDRHDVERLEASESFSHG